MTSCWPRKTDHEIAPEKPAMTTPQAMVDTILSAYPDAVAIYRFGSWGTPHQRPDSDLDLAVLLPHDTATNLPLKDWADLNGKLAWATHTDRVDLINLRTANTTLQAEVLSTGETLFSADEDARLAFEVLVLSKDQELNAWREDLKEGLLNDDSEVAPP